MLEEIPAQGKDPQTHAIIGAAMEVHRHLGRGFLESVYQEALAVELTLRGIPFGREIELAVRYKGRELPGVFKADFVCFDEVIVELKAIAELSIREHSQIINYLRATGKKVGLLINFASKSLEYKRFIDSSSPPI